jgi:hypothetical protein
MDTLKQVVAVIATVLTFTAYISYFRDILKGKTHPHIYSWALWWFLGVLVVALQIEGEAGAAVLVSVAASMMCAVVVLLSLKRGTRDITKLDGHVAFLGLLAIVFWLIVKQPVVSVILLIVADLLAFIPTIRKSWNKPHSETLSLYVTNAVRFSMALFAVKEYSFLSSAWIIFWALGNGLFALMLIVRRRQLNSV